MIAALIVAAGRGRRLGAEVPKQYLDLGGTPVLRRTMEAFLAVPDITRVQVVIGPGDEPQYLQAIAGLDDTRLAPALSGGATRAQSVHAGLLGLAGHATTKVLIHDGARPFASTALILSVIGALNTSEGAFAALQVVDALWRADGDKAATPVGRDGLWRAQTPQGFDFKRILQAHEQSDGMAADDVEVARMAGMDVRLVPGDEANFKITTQADLERARRLVT